MRVIRTFHPVGQGAFYSERFYEDGESEAKYNIVYDCGTSWGSIMKAKKVVSQAFDKKDVIDYLFISHLDYDHISLVLTLIDCVKGIREIVLPLVLRNDIVIAVALNRISNHEDAADFLQMISDSMGTDRRDNNLKVLESRISFVGSEEESVPRNTQLWMNGERRTIGDGPDWVLIPYNVKSQDRRMELITEFDKLLHDVKLLKKLDGCRIALPSRGDELYEMLKNPNFVKEVIATRELKNAIKSAYEKVSGGINANSLLLYSGPLNEKSFIMRSCGFGYCCRYCFCIHNPGCLYTGDSDCDLKEWSTHAFCNVWKNIGTIQLPHHGSQKSFDFKKNPIDTEYIFPVSCGSVNTYGHPSGKVLSYLSAKGCCPKIVTELANTIFVEVMDERESV